MTHQPESAKKSPQGESMTAMPTHARAERTHARKKHTLTRGQGIAVAVIIGAFALGLAGYAAAASYASVSHLAASRHVPLARYCPIGIDGGLLAVIIFDIALTWIRKPIAGLRLAARLFAAGTIAANAAAGWPDPVSVGLRIAAPALFVIIVEAGRSVLLNRGQEATSRIPLARWMLAPRSTFTIWRRKKLWTDARLPQAAIDAELAIVQLHDFYGDEWQEKAPARLVWMVQAGVNMGEALAMVAELTAPKPEPEPVSAPVSSGQNKRRSSGRTSTRSSTVNKRASSTRKTAASSTPEPKVPDDVDTQAEALRILAAEPDISGSELGRRLGMTPRYGCTLKKNLAGSVVGGDAS